MAQGSSSRGTRSAAGRRAPAARSGGSNNAMAVGVAAILVLGVVAAIILMSGGKDPNVPVPPASPPAPPSSAKVDGPSAPVRGPPPAVPLAMILSARDKVKTFAAIAERGKAAYAEAQAARSANDQELWQDKLREAGEYFGQINDEWNEVIDALPEAKDWDKEDVANHYLGRESGDVTKMVEPLEGIRKSLRPK